MTLSACMATPDPENAELIAIVRQIEASVTLPQTRPGQGKYYRYYDWSELDGRRVVEGHYLVERVAPVGSDLAEPVSRLPNVFLWHGEELPFIYDGLCAQVTVFFDVEAGKLVSQRCNGHV